MSELTQDERSELESLRARVAALETERHECAARAAAVVAAANERVYWLDRWHVDLNAMMARRGAKELRGVVRAMRWVVRRLRLLKRRLAG